MLREPPHLLLEGLILLKVLVHLLLQGAALGSQLQLPQLGVSGQAGVP